MHCSASLCYGRVDTELPASQSCTFEQVAAVLISTAQFGRERTAVIDGAFEASSTAFERWELIESGPVVLGLRYRAGSNLVSSSATADGGSLSRNEIGQWSLRPIGSGYSVAQLAFAPTAQLVVDERGLAGFVLIIQRSRL